MEGYHEAIRATVEALAEGGAVRRKHQFDSRFSLVPRTSGISRRLWQPSASPFTMLPDYSETLDGEAWADYQKLSTGGTAIESIREMGRATATIQLGRSLEGLKTAASCLEEGSTCAR